jgi:hypothetical protein
MALFLVAREAMEKLPFTRTGLFRLYSGQEVVNLLAEAGFSRACLRMQMTNLGPGRGDGVQVS